MAEATKRYHAWSDRHPDLTELMHMIAIFVGACAVLFAFVLIYNSMSGRDALYVECLQYETIGDMPAKCLDLFN